MEFKYLYLLPKNVRVSRLSKNRFQASLKVNSTSVDLSRTMQTEFFTMIKVSIFSSIYLAILLGNHFSCGELPRCFVNMIPI